MFLKKLVYTLSACFVLSGMMHSQDDCCSVTLLTSLTSSDTTILDSGFFSNGCFTFLNLGAVEPTRYNTQTCVFLTPARNELRYLGSRSQMTAIFGTSCERLVISDPNNNAIHSYSFGNCALGAELQTISIPHASALASNATCLAVGREDIAQVSLFTHNAVCSIAPTPVATIDLTGLITTLGIGQLVFSPPQSACSFLVALGRGSNASNPFVIIPMIGCIPQTPVAYSFGGNQAKAAAISPDGKCLAVSYITENVVRIFSINPDCSLSPAPIQTVNTIGKIPNDIAYSPDNFCFSIAN